MDKRKSRRPKAATVASGHARRTKGVRKTASPVPAKGRSIRPAARTQDRGRVTWRPSWSKAKAFRLRPGEAGRAEGDAKPG
jgi:hypothetical protein